MSDTEIRTLDQITLDLGIEYKAWKGAEKRKDSLRKEFFELATDGAEQALAEKLVVIDAASSDAALARVDKEYPGWTADDWREVDANVFEIIMTEDPAFKPFSYYNPEDGMLYKRQVTSGSPMLDDERLRSEDPDLYLAVTTIPNREQIESVMYECGVDHTELSRRLDELWQGERVLRDLGKLPADQLNALSRYMYEGKPTVKLAAPRKAKPEEIPDE